MPREITSLQAFNRGKISKLGLARTDLDRTRLSAEEQTNYVPRVLGSMMLRPGLGYIDTTYNNAKAVNLPFIAATNDMAIIELTDLQMRVRVDEAVIVRPSVSTAFTNGTFDTDLTGWTDADQSGATSTWATGGYMSLVGTRYNSAIRQQTLSISAPDQNVEHAVRVVVTRGIVSIRIGTTTGDDDLLTTAQLLPGTHSLAFTPTGSNAFVELFATTQYATLVDSIAIEASGDMVLPTIWTESDLPNIRICQSVDVIFCACVGDRQQRIERRAVRSWSVVDYITEDGPFRTLNTSAITMTAAALTGDTTLTASQKYFKSTNVGSLFKLTSIGQTVSSTLTGDGQFTNYIKVIGVGTSRNFTITVSGTWTGTLTVQRSVAEPGAFANTTTTYTSNTTVTYNDALDNQIIYYRVGFDTGGYGSGSAVVTLTYSSGGLEGIAKVTSYTSPTVVNVSVLQDFGSTTATESWSEGDWSSRRGYPSAVALYEGRLWWAGKDNVWASVSDAFASFDETVEGDSGPINRTIGEGPVDTINWLLPLQRLLVGGQGAEFSIRSSSFDELLSPDNFNIKTLSTQGSDAVMAEKVDGGGFFVQQGGVKVYEIAYDADTYDYKTNDLTMLVPEMLVQGVARMDVQRKPDTRLHCVLDDGTVALLVFDKAEEVTSWINIETDGIIEDVLVMPSTPEDSVYYIVKRTINGSTVRYLEKWALESECVGGTLNKQADSFILYSGAATATITGLDTLEGESVVCWADGVDQGTFTVSGGSITLPASVSSAVVGVTYRARYKSTKLAYAAEGGSALNATKRAVSVALIMANTHRYGVEYGGDYDHLDSLPGVEAGADVDDDYVWEHYDEDRMPLNGDWSTDSRLCLESNAPKPATILAVTLTMETNA